jgi:hypothetical protein
VEVAHNLILARSGIDYSRIVIRKSAEDQMNVQARFARDEANPEQPKAVMDRIQTWLSELPQGSLAQSCSGLTDSSLM